MRTAGALRDRAVGALLGLACGDALGVPYEFDHLALGPDEEPRPCGGGPAGFAPGEWSDDTAMAIAVAQGLAAGGSLAERLDAVAGRFLDWYDAEPADIGRQTRAVLSAVAAGPRTGAAMRAHATSYARTHPHAAGNGALMRTAPVALAFLDDRAACAEAARAVAGLTHADPQAQDACVLWTEAIRVAVTAGDLAVAAGLDLVEDRWRVILAEAATGDLGHFHPNGWAVRTVQVAYGAILRAGGDLEESLAAAIRVGDDTDTTAAVAGSLLGALHGASAVPQRWLAPLHGWPGLRAADLAELALRLVG
ncbi:ADP-ribosylglycohydrolase family protein [Nocardioides sp.]|jgi:ADP-ribosylglycohydrolase|uniref:ADP-ribosylglycohydrolase family protein n=1 Tax=Nocardioides sp. TaxID=35761 RepID=UPI002CF2B0D4|nr:ADP-ribosylglycohydrolase family protein [Nocardioides sp.]HVX54159.1 ADP-ribosylglycohydrolase family protein [Nocardioides sp.]